MKKALFILMVLLCTNRAMNAQKSAVFNPVEGAIHGYDPVAYFKQGRAVKGDTAISFSWNQAVWYFSSLENRDSFRVDPLRFAPQYGGYCAYGMAGGHKAPTDPEAFSILNGKLYLNYNKNVQALWKKKPEEFIETANRNWPVLKDKE